MFDPAVFTFNSCTVLAPYNTYVASCDIPQGETNLVRFLVFRIPSGAIASGTFFDIEFGVIGPAGSYQMTVENPSSATQPLDTDPALIDVLGPAYDSSTIAPNDPFAFPATTMGDPNPTLDTDVSNMTQVPNHHRRSLPPFLPRGPARFSTSFELELTADGPKYMKKNNVYIRQ